jgi:hypothetical protein
LASIAIKALPASKVTDEAEPANTNVQQEGKGVLDQSSYMHNMQTLSKVNYLSIQTMSSMTTSDDCL